uniref:Ubiquitin carboxyl-terminal hydrolase n=1 Tax=Xenopsylla cheopis TaxID=163159 RepID=A0A6M2DER8_XENCH
MNCPHIISSVKVNRDLLSGRNGTTKNWHCMDCKSVGQNWLCLYCGVVLCGRYNNQHAKQHAESNLSHDLCMQCEIFSVFCYKCDDYVCAEQNEYLIENVRQLLHEYNSHETSNEISPCASVSDIMDDNIQPSKNDLDEPVRNLRPRARKRSASTDTSSVENEIQSMKKANKNREKKVVGLRNLGNTCFMNAVLQSLSNIQEFSCYFSSLPSLENKNNGRRIYHSRSYKEFNDIHLVEELRKVLINLSQGGCGSKGTAISPECLFLVIWKVVPRFRGYQQQDAHEFLRYVLDRLHTELQQLLPDVNLKEGTYISSMKGRSSIVTSVFGGTLQSEVKCLQCGTQSRKHDPFLDLSLDIPDRFSEKKNKEESEEPMCNISDCLTSFTEIEELAETELYYCSSCKSKQRSTKQFWIRRLPNVLCLHIKRFRWNNFFRTKIDVNISFPITSLDMSAFVLTNIPETRKSLIGGPGHNLYDLAAVIVHHGSGAGSGHYTSFANHSGQWFHFNDSTVRTTDVDTVAACKPYILFYIRRELNLSLNQGIANGDNS